MLSLHGGGGWKGPARCEGPVSGHGDCDPDTENPKAGAGTLGVPPGAQLSPAQTRAALGACRVPSSSEGIPRAGRGGGLAALLRLLPEPRVWGAAGSRRRGPEGGGGPAGLGASLLLSLQRERVRPAAVRGALLLPVHRVCEHGGGKGGPAALLAEGRLLLRVRGRGPGLTRLPQTLLLQVTVLAGLGGR